MKEWYIQEAQPEGKGHKVLLFGQPEFASGMSVDEMLKSYARKLQGFYKFGARKQVPGLQVQGVNIPAMLVEFILLGGVSKYLFVLPPRVKLNRA